MKRQQPAPRVARYDKTIVRRKTMGTAWGIANEHVAHPAKANAPAFLQDVIRPDEHSAVRRFRRPATCPTCSGPMAVRKNRKKRDAFLGCQAYPVCKGTRSLPPMYRTQAARPP